jgi:hypothetical protein
LQTFGNNSRPMTIISVTNGALDVGSRTRLSD